MNAHREMFTRHWLAVQLMSILQGDEPATIEKVIDAAIAEFKLIDEANGRYPQYTGVYHSEQVQRALGDSTANQLPQELAALTFTQIREVFVELPYASMRYHIRTQLRHARHLLNADFRRLLGREVSPEELKAAQRFVTVAETLPPETAHHEAVEAVYEVMCGYTKAVFPGSDGNRSAAPRSFNVH
jgi:hypothetical protein